MPVMTMPDPLQQMAVLFAGIGVVLVVASTIGLVLKATVAQGQPHGEIDNLNTRIRAWWVMVVVIGCALLLGRAGVTLLFLFASIAALREFVSVACESSNDHWRITTACLVVLLLQYLLVYVGWYKAFALFVPVFAFLILPIVIAAVGDVGGDDAFAARMQLGLMICVYGASYVPALLTLDIAGYDGRGVLLIVFLILVVQASDVLQYVWGKLCGRRKLAPVVSPSKTWEGLVGGVASATALGAALYWITPFAAWQAALIALTITTTGFIGGLVMSAIKRDSGAKDWGRMIDGHGGMLDRLDSVAFAAPVFFYVTRLGWA
jgi:phosphatidate cytidylyltransferase